MQRRLSSRFVVRLVAMLALMGTFAILGCSDDDKTTNINIGVLRVTDANAAMMGGEAFTFSNGVEAFGTTGTSTTVAFNDDATEADITAGDFTASAGAEYGSCIFTVGASEFEPPHRLAPGSPRITIPQCTLNITAVDVPESGDSVPGVAILTLGLVTSGAVEVEVQLGEDDSLFVNGVDTGIDITGSEGDTDD